MLPQRNPPATVNPPPRPRPGPNGHAHPPRPGRVRRRGGCLSNAAVALFVLVMLPVFVCGVCSVVYLVFPPAAADILILGLDARPGEGSVTRTDTIMLMGVQPERLRVSLLSIPRDLSLEVPVYGLERVNTINVLGEQEGEGRGIVLLEQSIGSNFGIVTENYVRLNFQGFIALVDAVGGVSIDVERVIEDYAYPTMDGGTMTIRFEPGVQQMDGERALMYVRTRHGDDDYQRAERQQQVMSALSLRLLNPLNWGSAARVLTSSVETDLSAWDLARLAPTVLLNAGRFESLVIDREYITGTAGGVTVPDYARLAGWVNERFE